MTDRELLQQALETAEGIVNADYRHWQELSSLAEFERWVRSRANHMAGLLRARLSQCDRCGEVNPAEIHTCTPKEQEPVAWMYDWTTSDGEFIQDWTTSEAETLRDTKPNIISNIRPLYTTPPQREWVGLTHKEHMEIMTGTMTTSSRMAAVEAKLKEKNT